MRLLEAKKSFSVLLEAAEKSFYQNKFLQVLTAKFGQIQEGNKNGY